MKTLIIVIVPLVVLLVILALVLPRMRRQATERKQVQARDHLQEAQLRTAQADSAQAAADEQAARARREQAEAQLRVADAQRDVEARQAEATRHREEAESLQQKAARLDPNLQTGGTAARAESGMRAGAADLTGGNRLGPDDADRGPGGPTGAMDDPNYRAGRQDPGTR